MATSLIPANGHNGHTPQPIMVEPDGSNIQEALAASLALHQQKREINLDLAVARRKILIEATSRLMTEGVDYGKIPGSDKPCLLQPGADKLCNLFNLVIEYETIENVKDWTGKDHGGESFFYYESRGYAYHRDGALMGEGIGSCNSWESKYRWRKGERKCPNCKADTIIKGREEYGGGWVCFLKKGGCGAKFRDGDQSIEGQQVGRVKNPDVCNEVNTIQKIGMKRCKISTTINATSASEFFTQDAEDRVEEEPPAPKTAAPAPQPAPQPAPEPQPARTAPTPIRNQALRPNSKPWRTLGEMKQCFKVLKEQMPWPMYNAVLQAHGIPEAFSGIKPAQQEAALKCYRVLEGKIEEYKGKAADPQTYEHFEVTEGEWQ